MNTHCHACQAVYHNALAQYYQLRADVEEDLFRIGNEMDKLQREQADQIATLKAYYDNQPVANRCYCSTHKPV